MTLQETLGIYTKERQELQDEQLRLSQELSKAKFGKRAKFRRALRKVKQSIRRIDRLIKETQNELRKEGKNEVSEILANQGIDSKTNQIGAIGKIVGDVSKTASSLIGGGRSIGSVSRPTGTIGTTKTTYQESGSGKNNMTYIIGGIALAVGLFIYMKNRK